MTHSHRATKGNKIYVVHSLHKYRLQIGHHETIREVPSRDHVVVLMDADARTGGREDGCSDANVMGAYGRDVLNDN